MLMPLQPEMPLYLHKVSDEGGGEVYSLKKRRMGACDIACATRGAGQSPCPVAGPVLADGAAGGLACTAADKEAVAGAAQLPRDGGEG